MAEGYSLRDVDRMLGLSRSVVRGLIAAGFVTPARGPRREYRFGFQDLVVLRVAHSLAQARISPARIVRSLRSLRDKLPATVPLTGLTIRAVGNAVVVSEGGSQWASDDGQYVLQFDVAGQHGKLKILASPAPTVAEPSASPGDPKPDWFARAAALEGRPDEAALWYRNAIEADARHTDAYVNLGCLLHELGRLDEARAVYREGLAACGPDATLLFNLAVLEEDLKEPREAQKHYLEAVALNRELADAHFNLARLFEASGAQHEALRHWSAYRRLTASSR